jgi:Peptidase A4 family
VPEHAVEPERGLRELRALGVLTPPGSQFPTATGVRHLFERGRRRLARLRFVSLLRPVGPLPLIVIIALALPSTISLTVSLGISAARSHAASLPPRLGQGALETSSNWAGYVATHGRFTSVSASWTVPLVKGGLQPTEVAAMWVGLDGRGTSTLEQIGTISGMLGGSPAYEVWFEIVPKAPEYVQMTLKPGDSVTASVTTSGNGQFTLFIRDNTTHVDFSTVQPSAGSELVTAEVVAEAPSTISGPSPLPDFGTVRFANARANGRPIGTFTWDRLNMSSGTVPQADTSTLARDAGSFSVTWRHE